MKSYLYVLKVAETWFMLDGERYIFFGKSVSRFVCRLKGTLIHTSVFWINLILVLIFCPLNHAFILTPIFKRNIWPLGVHGLNVWWQKVIITVWEKQFGRVIFSLDDVTQNYRTLPPSKIQSLWNVHEFIRWLSTTSGFSPALS